MNVRLAGLALVWVVVAAVPVLGGCGVSPGEAVGPSVASGARAGVAPPSTLESLAAIESRRDIIQSPREVERALARAGSDMAELEGLKKAVVHGTQWGRLGSLRNLQQSLLRHRVRAVSDGRGGSLGDIMQYLFFRKCQDPLSDEFLQRVSSDVETSYVLGQVSASAHHSVRVPMSDTPAGGGDAAR